MAIKHRRGDYNDYNPTKMQPSELAVTLQNDPKAVDGKALHVAFGSGVDKTLMTFEDAEGMIEDATAEAIAGATEPANESALKSEGYSVGKQNGTDVSSGTYYKNNAKYYKEQAASSASSAEAAVAEIIAADIDDKLALITTYKNQAQSAASTATTANTNAQSAKTDAVSAKDLAKGYRDEAEEFRDQAAASAGSVTYSFSVDSGGYLCLNYNPQTTSE